MNLKNNIAVIIPAAGSSSRFDGKLPKQFLNIGHETVLEKTVNLFLGITSVKKIFIAINPAEKIIQSQSFYDHSRINIVEGGNSRSQSVLNALDEIDDDISIVAIHDAARPWLRKDHFNDLLSEFINDQNIHGVYPVIPISDSLRMNSKSGPIPVQREDFLGVQTPQIFYIDNLKKAFKQANKKDLNFSDESQLMEYAGFKISSIPGDTSNSKITYKDDLPDNHQQDSRVGRGVDFHKFESGNGIILGNVHIECDKKIVAHSDGDIVLHAIADALLGAAGLRDIGYYFPDTDPKNKNISSLKILQKCIDLLNKESLEPSNIDFVIVCEEPKIGPHVNDIKQSLSSILNIQENHIGVKATTTEKMGIIGDGNGIAVFAIASLRKGS